MQQRDLIVLSICFMLQAVTVYGSDYGNKKELTNTIDHLERLARVAIKNGLDSLAASYRSKAQLLAQGLQKNDDKIMQLEVSNQVAHKAAL
jgi:hypothetical protein